MMPGPSTHVDQSWCQDIVSSAGGGGGAGAEAGAAAPDGKEDAKADPVRNT